MFDLSFLAPLVEAFKAHAYGTCALILLFAILNAAFRWKTPAQWVVVLDSYPRVHALMDVVRAFVQPVELLDALRRVVTGDWPKPPTLPPPNSSSDTRSTNVPPSARPPAASRVRFIPRVAILLGLLVCVVQVLGCEAFTGPAKTPEQFVDTVLTDADKLCILSNAAYPNETVQKLCKLPAAIKGVWALIDSLAAPHRREVATARERGLAEGRLVGAAKCAQGAR